MAGLDGDDGCSDLDAFGDLAEKRDRRHGVEVTGNLGNPERRETLAFRSLSVGQQTAQPVRTCALLVGADHHADSHRALLGQVAIQLKGYHKVKWRGEKRLDTRVTPAFFERGPKPRRGGDRVVV